MPELHDFACPFCGILCDDLSVNTEDGCLIPTANACEVSRRGFKNFNALAATAGTTNNDEAIKKASELLANALAPLILVTSADVASARASVRLAEQCGGVIDHINSPALMRNISVVQYSGWFTGTFAEVRNRSELIVIVGDKIFDRYPRLIERVLLPEKSLLEESLEKRKFAFIGPWKNNTIPESLQARNPIIINAELSRMSNIVSLVRTMQSTNTIDQFDIEAPLKRSIEKLSSQIDSSSYSSVVWTAGDFNFPHSELLVQNLVDWVRTLNNKSRAVALPIGGTNGDMTLNQVCTWQSGVPIRTSFARGYPEHDPFLFNHRRMLDSGEVDLLVLIGNGDIDLNINKDIDCIVVGGQNQKSNTTKQVHIQTGVTGLHHSGHMFRGDGVVSIPLRRLQTIDLPPPAQVLDQISNQLKSN